MEAQMLRKCLGLIGLIGVVLILTACAGPRQLETDYGTSVKLAIANQTLDPEAGKNLEPVREFDGKAAQAAIEKYQKDFEKPAPPPVYTFSIGAAGR
jgi:hypothetical protein